MELPAVLGGPQGPPQAAPGWHLVADTYSEAAASASVSVASIIPCAAFPLCAPQTLLSFLDPQLGARRGRRLVTRLEGGNQGPWDTLIGKCRLAHWRVALCGAGAVIAGLGGRAGVLRLRATL